MNKIGMILEGGGQRGIFTAGVLDYLMEKEFYLPYVIGVSAGACNAVDYKSGQIGRTKICMVDAQTEHKYISIQTLIRKGYLFDMNMVFDKFPNELVPFDYDAYFANDMRCLIEASNCLTGEPVYLEEYEDRRRLMIACRASASLPLLAPTVKLDNILMLDGGITDSIPIRKAISDGYDKNVVIMTKIPRYRKPEKASKKMMHLARMKYKKYPEFLKAMENRNSYYNETVDYIESLEKEGKVFVIRPQVDGVERAERNLEKLNAQYNHGREVAESVYEDLLRFANTTE